MNNPLRTIIVTLLLLILLQVSSLNAQPENLDLQPQTEEITPWIIPCKDMVDRGLYESIKRRTKTALDSGAEYVIYEIDTYGGDLFSAFDISNYFLHEINPETHTVAYVSKKAISAGAMISVACEEIIMKEKTTIGDCAPIQIGGKLEGVQREKVETVTRAAFVNSAEANGYPEALLKAMVTMQIEVYRIKNIKTGQYEFFEGDRLPKDKKRYDLENKELIVKGDELLTLTASQAVEYSVAKTQVKNLEGALDFLAERDGVTFAKPVVLHTTWSEEMVRWINSPTVMGILVMLAMLGVYMELNTPGVGLPGLVAVICIVIIIGSKYLTGLANWVEVALFVTGLVLLFVEIFITPGFGLIGGTGIICILAGLFGMLIKNPPDRIPWPQTQIDWQLFNDGVISLAIGLTGFAVLAWMLAKYLPKSKLEFLSGLILVPVAKKGGRAKISMTAPPESKTAAVNIGDIGEVITTLRPAGKVKFGDAVVDVIAEADFLQKGTEVEIIEISGNKVIVRAVNTTEG